MSEQLTGHEEILSEMTTTPATEVETPEDAVPENEGVAGIPVTAKPKSSKKKFIIIAAAVVAVIAIAAVLLIPSKFERVKNECVQIAGRVAGGGDYFEIDAYPDDFDNIDPAVAALLAPSTQEDALKAIKYANEALGFNGSLYSQMLNTTALMGRQSAETSKYRVSWTYHPDNGLEVTYEKK